MTRTEHFAKLQAGDISPRVVLHDNRPPSEWLYVAWTPTWEGPARPDYQSAATDLAERTKATRHSKPHSYMGVTEARQVIRLCENPFEGLATLNGMSVRLGLCKPSDDAATVIRRMRNAAEFTIKHHAPENDG